MRRRRDNRLLEKRNAKIAARYYYWTEIQRYRSDDAIRQLSEEEFFHSTESGGTVVSSALVLLEQIVRARYPVGDWNIYVAQASDGDNFGDDGANCRALLAERG